MEFEDDEQFVTWTHSAPARLVGALLVIALLAYYVVPLGGGFVERVRRLVWPAIEAPHPLPVAPEPANHPSLPT